MLILISYLSEIRLEVVKRNSIQPIILSLKKGRLMLGTEHTIYSWDDRYMNFVWGLEHINLNKSTHYRVLVLGFGLGAIAYILEKKMRIEFQMTGVEINPDIVHLAQKYSIIRLNSPIEVLCADAHRFMQSNVDQ